MAHLSRARAAKTPGLLWLSACRGSGSGSFQKEDGVWAYVSVFGPATVGSLCFGLGVCGVLMVFYGVRASERVMDDDSGDSDRARKRVAPLVKAVLFAGPP